MFYSTYRVKSRTIRKGGNTLGARREDDAEDLRGGRILGLILARLLLLLEMS